MLFLSFQMADCKNGTGDDDLLLDNAVKKAVNGGDNSNGDHLQDDDSIVMNGDHGSSDLETEERKGSGEHEKKINGEKSPEKASRRKSPMKCREIEEVAESEEDDNDVEEVKDDNDSGSGSDSDSDSDIMELEAELADLHGKQAALLFNSGYMSNWTTLSTLASGVNITVMPHFSQALRSI